MIQGVWILFTVLCISKQVYWYYYSILQHYTQILRQSGLHKFHAVILENFPSVSTVISPLRPRGNFMYRTFYTLTKCKYCITACLCVSYDYQSKDSWYGECLLRGTIWLYVEVSVLSPLKGPFMAQAGSRLHLNPENSVPFQEVPTRLWGRQNVTL
jgi:hypothetical protein